MSCIAAVVPIIRTRPPIVLLGNDASRGRIRLILDAHPNISCPPGSSFLLYLNRVTDKRGIKLADFRGAEQLWPQRVADFFESSRIRFAQHQGKARWAAEIPGHEVGRVDTFFPSAQVIHGLEPGSPTSEISNARQLGAEMEPGRYLEIWDEDLLLRPQLTVRALIEFLGEPWR